jgi:putative ABC transport system permease protein
MIIHVFKLLWNSRKKSMLIALETTLACCILVLVLASTTNIYSRLSAGNGFNHEGIWHISAGRNTRTDWSGLKIDLLKDLTESLKQFSEVEHAFFMVNVPYFNHVYRSTVSFNQHSIKTRFNYLSPDAFDGLGIVPKEGRLINYDDFNSDYTPAVINLHLAQELFGSESPIGKMIEFKDNNNIKVIGVVERFRIQGEFTDSNQNDVLFGLDTEQNSEELPIFEMMLKLKLDIDANFEEKLLEHIKSFSKNGTYLMRSIEVARKNHINNNVKPIILAGVVAVFLVIMVAFGLFGVLWQNVLTRTKELGLRRALGASAQSIRRQVILERLVLSLCACLFAGILMMQIPLLGNIDILNWANFTVGFVGATGFILLITWICSLYPSYLATKIHPSTALHYE